MLAFLRSDSLLLLISYGSQESDGDSDYFAVYNDAPNIEIFEAGRLDLVKSSLSAASYLICRFDPLVTEPLLEGKVLFDAEGALELLQKQVRDALWTCEAKRHLRMKSLTAYLNAQACLASGLWNPRLFSVNMSFALSYHLYQRYYDSVEKAKPVRLRSMLDIADPCFVKAFNLARSFRRSQGGPEPAEDVFDYVGEQLFFRR